MNPELQSKIELLPIIVPVLIIAFTLHELAHGVVANWLGDGTAKRQGRLTLNPIKHLDPVGSGLLVFTFLFTPFAFGWAKPIPVNHRNLKKPQRDFALVAVAGPMVNILIALVTCAVFFYGGFGELIDGSIAREEGYISKFLAYVILINVVLTLFNLLPIPPLDGSRIVGVFLNKQQYQKWLELDRLAPVFLILFLVLTQNGSNNYVSQAVGWGVKAIFYGIGAG